jgi:glycosyltransferase involved in cell wall biosynthesis
MDSGMPGRTPSAATTRSKREPSPDRSGLRVAVLAPISWRVPPRHYGPWEQFASLLTEGLVSREIDVTLFATSDSVTAGRLASVVDRPYSEDGDVDPKVAECLHIAHLFERAAEFDIIHNSFDFLPLTYSGLVDTPVITTIHGFSSPRIRSVYRRYDATTSYIAISDADRDPDLHYLATIHHGIDTGAFPPGAATGGYLLFFGRIHPDKGTAEAIDVALAAGKRLLIAGIVQDQRYFDECVAPRLDGERVAFLGAVAADERAEVLGGADALLHLISFDEPFGYSVAEAMTCGTPVIAFARGSMAELIDDGTTGFLVADVPSAVVAVERAAGLDRAAIRARAVGLFGVGRMVDAYLTAYEEVVG